MVIKLFNRYFGVKLANAPLFAISSHYFNKMRPEYEDRDCRLLTKGFEDGYKQCLKDMGIKEVPRAKRGG